MCIVRTTGAAGFWRTEAKRELSKCFELFSMFVPCDTHWIMHVDRTQNWGPTSGSFLTEQHYDASIQILKYLHNSYLLVAFSWRALGMSLILQCTSLEYRWLCTEYKWVHWTRKLLHVKRGKMLHYCERARS